MSDDISLDDDIGEDDPLSDDISLDDDIGEDDFLTDDLSLDDNFDLDDADPLLDDESATTVEIESDGVDLSSLEDELGLEGDDLVEAPDVEAIKEVESEDELERELASLGSDLDSGSKVETELGETADDISLDDEDEDISLDDSDISLDMDEDLELSDELSVDDDSDLSLELDSDDGELDSSLDDEVSMDMDDEEIFESELMLEDDDELLMDEDSDNEIESGDLMLEEESMVLDESMEIQELEPDEIADSGDGDIAFDSDEELDVSLEDSIDDDTLSLDVEETAEEDELALTDDVFGDDTQEEDMIEIGDMSDEGFGEVDIDTESDFSFSADDADGDAFLDPLDENDEELTMPMEVDISDESSTINENVLQKEPIIAKSLLLTLPHQLTVEIGKASLKGEDITHLTYGSIIELDKKVGEPVDIILGTKLIAKGEVVQINDEQLGVRITRIDY